MRAERWDYQAACRGLDVDRWYAGRTTLDTRYARQVCAGCPVRRPCLADVLEQERDWSIYSRWGMWGGTTPRQRAAIAEGTGHGTESRPPRCACGPCTDQALLELALIVRGPPARPAA